MAGITDTPFRLVCRRGGADMVWTEMISARALLQKNRRTVDLAVFTAEERPIAAQIFGREPEDVAAAAVDVAARGADMVDINMACPVRKILRGGSGAQLMREPERAEAMVAAAVRAVKVPVTVKIRLGWAEDEANYEDFARRMEGAGAAAIILHPRTRAEGYSGRARWEAVARLKQAVAVPVVGSGDVVGGPGAEELFSSAGCDAVMVGRASLGRPWIFRQIRAYLDMGEQVQVNEVDLDLVALHVALILEHQPPKKRTGHLRKHLAWYSRGLPGGAHFRDRVMHAPDQDAILAEAHTFLGI